MKTIHNIRKLARQSACFLVVWRDIHSKLVQSLPDDMKDAWNRAANDAWSAYYESTERLEAWVEKLADRKMKEREDAS